MATLKVNGSGAIAAQLILPRSGAGTLTARIATLAGPGIGEEITAEFEDGTTYALTVTRAGPLAGAWQLKAVLGKHKMREIVPPLYYEGIPRNTALQDVLNEAGETPGLIDTPGTLSSWTRNRNPAHIALALLLTGTGISWRMNPDGTVRIAEEDWPDGPPVTVIREAAGTGRLHTTGTWAAQPGTILAGVQADTVIHRVGPNRGTEIWSN